MTTIALTGATGFVGRQILARLLDRHARVRVIRRPPDQNGALALPGDVEVITTEDLFSESVDKLAEILAGSDILIHAAWYTTHRDYLTSPRNLDCLTGTLSLAQAFQRAGGRRFIGIGTCAEYDFDAGLLRPTTPLKPTVLYSACKSAAYEVLSQLLPAAGIELAWCRLFYLYGEGEAPSRLVPYIRSRLEAGLPAELTSGYQIRDFLDVAEAGRRIADISLGQRQGAINVCSGIPTTVRQLAEHIADEYGRRDLLHFGARPDNRFDPPCVVGYCETEET